VGAGGARGFAHLLENGSRAARFITAPVLP
jgi:hypothetical protein